MDPEVYALSVAAAGDESACGPLGDWYEERGFDLAATLARQGHVTSSAREWGKQFPGDSFEADYRKLFYLTHHLDASGWGRFVPRRNGKSFTMRAIADLARASGLKVVEVGSKSKAST